MIVHEIFAFIFEDEVKTVTICPNYSEANYVAQAVFGQTAFAVPCYNVPCVVGDKYQDGYFWHVNPDTGEETIIERLPTQEEQVQSLKVDNEELTLVLAEIIGGVENA